MASNHDQMKMSEEEESFLRATQMPSGVALGLVLKTALELDLFEIMAKAGPNAQLSASEISSFLDTKNPQAPVMLDRILRFLANQSYVLCNLTTDEDGHVKRLYSLAPVSKALVRNGDGVSISALLITQLDKVFMQAWYHLKDAILEGGAPFERAYGMNAFEYPSIDSRFNEVFNKGMYNHTTIAMKKVLEVYKGFEGVKEFVDVGGGLGASLALIVSKYPDIKGINFDLPHVIKDAPAYPGVEHIAGDMFQSVPKGDAIFMKWILHDWSDEHCLKLLKNCRKALPESGKVIIVDAILPEYPKSDVISTIGFFTDVGMMVVNPGGKEKTHKEFEVLAKEAGFASFKPICPAYNNWVIELHKN